MIGTLIQLGLTKGIEKGVDALASLTSGDTSEDTEEWNPFGLAEQMGMKPIGGYIPPAPASPAGAPAGGGTVVSSPEEFAAIGSYGGVRGEEIRQERGSPYPGGYAPSATTAAPPATTAAGGYTAREPEDVISPFMDYYKQLAETSERTSEESWERMEEAQKQQYEYKMKLAEEMNEYMEKERRRRESERAALRSSLLGTFESANRNYQMQIESIVSQQRGRQAQGRGVYAGLSNVGGA